jgi:hypothetical protein
VKPYATVGEFKIKVPPHLEDSCHPINLYRTCHGHDFSAGDYACPACESLTSFHEMCTIRGDPRCRVCGYYLPRLCNADGCDHLVASFGTPDYWCPPWPFCPTCIGDEMRELRSRYLERIPQRIRHAAVKAWEGRYEHRKDAGLVLSQWLSAKLGLDGGPSCLYLWGNVGSGKTTIAARAAIKAVHSGIIADVQWVKEGELLAAAKSQYSSESSAELLDSARHAALLVYDELWSGVHGYTDHVKQTLSSLFCLRFEEGRPTILTSNEPPLFVQVLDTRVDSRFNGCSRTVEVRGPDLRREQ